MVKDKRDKLWKVLEKDIQSRAGKKDKSFILSGKWKKFVRFQEGLKIFKVDGEWVKNNICTYFDHGGHAFVYEFIPVNEIWINSNHYYKKDFPVSTCGCKTKTKNQKISKNFFESTVVHELVEFKEMKKGKNYWTAHQLALRAEIELGLLSDPYDDSQ